jgi:hypothetical protein
MDLGSGPEETSLNHTTGELSGESSLAGRVELPENRYSRRRSPIPEESPPRVNFLKKPMLRRNVPEKRETYRP